MTLKKRIIILTSVILLSTSCASSGIFLLEHKFDNSINIDFSEENLIEIIKQVAENNHIALDQNCQKEKRYEKAKLCFFGRPYHYFVFYIRSDLPSTLKIFHEVRFGKINAHDKFKMELINAISENFKIKINLFFKEFPMEKYGEENSIK